jgi:hypothetical protein
VLGVAMKSGVSNEPFLDTMGPHELDDGTQPTSAIVKRCRRGWSLVQVRRSVDGPLD